jgi:hypothetical protein
MSPMFTLCHELRRITRLDPDRPTLNTRADGKQPAAITVETLFKKWRRNNIRKSLIPTVDNRNPN